MTLKPNDPSSGQTTPPPKSYWPQIVITLVSAIVLGVGSCFGFLTTLNSRPRSPNLNMVFGWAFAVCVLTFLGALMWAVVAGIRSLLRKG
jgi:hypothetical protein